VDDDVRATAQWVDANVTQPVADETLAARAGLSVSRFRAKFREQMGMSAHEYVLRRKIDRAMQLLQASSRSITEIAHELAFSSSQYFATVFKRFTLRTPRAFAREARAGAKRPHV
jgi:AraC-like DNA-binding protein